MQRRVLGIFAKAPIAGQVKSRLAAGSDPLFAARLADSFIRDVIERYHGVGEERVVVFTPPESRDWFLSVAGSDYRLEEQGEGDLGQRLARFFRAQCGPYVAVVAVGTDSPSLPVAWMEQAFALLEEKDVVLGPAFDGGYYLIGMRVDQSSLFDISDWGGATVFAQTVERVRERSLKLGLLPPWYDVDTVDDARFLAIHLLGMQAAALDSAIPRTEALLRERFSPKTANGG